MIEYEKHQLIGSKFDLSNNYRDLDNSSKSDAGRLAAEEELINEIKRLKE